MQNTLTINAVNTIYIDAAATNETVKTFVDNLVRQKEKLDEPLFEVFAGIILNGNAIENLKKLKAGCCEALYRAYAARYRLRLEELYSMPDFAAAISHYAGERGLYSRILCSDDFDPLDRLCLGTHNRNLLWAEVLYSMSDEVLQSVLI